MIDSELEDLILIQGCHTQVPKAADAFLASHKQHDCLEFNKHSLYQDNFVAQAIDLYKTNIFFSLMSLIVWHRLLVLLKLVI